MEKEIIKQIVASILYLDDINHLRDNGSLFTEYELSSLDFIDLCFELSQRSNLNFKPDELWPFNKMMTDPECFAKENWTDEGWGKVCMLLGFDQATPKSGIRDLYNNFSIDYIHQRLSNFA